MTEANPEADRLRVLLDQLLGTLRDLEPGSYLVGLPVGVAISEEGKVTLTVYPEDMDKALREEDATDIHRALIEAALYRRDAEVTLG